MLTSSKSAGVSSCGLGESRVARTLDRLHRAARYDVFRMMLRAPLVLPDRFGWRKTDTAVLARRMRDVYLPISREQGRFLYVLARSIDARRVVEFGTSFAISTVYMAAAVRDNGGGRVIGTEIEPFKQARALEHLREAGLDGLAEVRLGNALETLADVDGPIDLVLLDWKDLYLPIIKLLRPRLRRGSLVVADNINLFKRSLQPYLDYMQSGDNGFVSTTLDLAAGFEVSVFTG